MRSLGILCISAAAFLVLAAATAYYVSTLTHEIVVTSYNRHVITKGDTVWDIARDYMPMQKETNDFREFIYYIKKANGWQKIPLLNVGDVVVIPLNWRETLK